MRAVLFCALISAPQRYLHPPYALPSGFTVLAGEGGHHHPRVYSSRAARRSWLRFRQDGSPAPGLANVTAEGWFPHGGLPILVTMVAVMLRGYSGTELIGGIAAGETRNPHKVDSGGHSPPCRRLIIFFIGARLRAGGA